METWNEAVDAHSTLVRALRTGEGQRWLDSTSEGLPDRPEGYARYRVNEAALVERTVAALPLSEPVFVSSDVAQLVREASETFEPESFCQEDFFTERGFAYFAEPVARLVRGEDHALVRGLQWDLASDLATATLYSEWRLADGSRPLVGGSRLALEETAPFWLGLRNPKYGSEYVERLLATFMRLAQQRIVLPLREKVQRAARRRSTHPARRDVVVFRLRRVEEKNASGERHPVNWSHRWVVRGFWRWQPYGDGTRRQVWIAPFIKGPDDKPLVLKPRAWNFDR